MNGACSMNGLTITRSGVRLFCDGLTISGPGNTVEDSTGVLINANRVVVQQCRIENFDVGIDAADGVSRLLIQANTLTENVKGIRGGEPLSSSRVVGNTSSNSVEFGIQLKNGPVDNLIMGNTTVNNGRTGIQLNSGAVNNRVILNYVIQEGAENGTRGGIRVDSMSERNVIRDNSITGGVFGVGFNSQTQWNVVHGNLIAGSTIAGIWFNGPSTRNTATSNLITDAQGEAVRIEAEADFHRLSSNVVTGSTGGGIEICGGNNQIVGNIAFNNEGFDYCIVGGQDNRLANNRGAVFNLTCPVPPECQDLNPPDEAGDVQ